MGSYSLCSGLRIPSLTMTNPPINAAMNRPVASVRFLSINFIMASPAKYITAATRKNRADRETAHLLRRLVGVRGLCERAGQGDVDALFELAVSWRAFDTGADVSPLVAVCEAQAPGSRLGRCLQAALPAARAVTTAGLRQQGLTGVALGRAVGVARREAMAAALGVAGLLT